MPVIQELERWREEEHKVKVTPQLLREFQARGGYVSLRLKDQKGKETENPVRFLSSRPSLLTSPRPLLGVPC